MSMPLGHGARRLLQLAATVEHGSFTRAAPALGMTQPALSRQIGALEAQVGLRLLNRGPAGVTPTPAGQALVQRGQAIGAQIEAAERALAGLRSLETGVLRLVAFPTAAATLAIDALRRLRSEHPRLTVTIEERDRFAALAAVRTGSAELAVTFATGGAGEVDELLDEVPLLEEEMLALLPADDPRVRAVRLGLAELADAGWIIGTGIGGRGLIVDACIAAGFEPQVVARLDNQPAIQAAVAAGLGVTLIPRLATLALRSDVVAVPLWPTAPFRRVSAHVLAGPHDPLVSAGIGALRTASRAIPGLSGAA
jgi:DNA-binding transcriptional LysR family regulator